MKTPLIGLCLLSCVVTAQAIAEDRPAPYAGQEIRSIKALSSEEIGGLLKGEGMGMAKPAELNGYPGPAHVLALAHELKLTQVQRAQVQAIFDRMKAQAKQLGAELVERERALDQLFASGEVTADRLFAETAAVSEIQGRLRSVHLTAHVQTKPLLRDHQIALYSKLRGYGHGAPKQHRHQHG